VSTTARSADALQGVLGQLRLNDRPITGTIQACDLVLEEGAHDQADLTVIAPMSEMNYGTVQSKTAFFDFGAQRQGRFYGYVVDITPQQKYQQMRQYYKLTLMGVTFVMKAGHPRFYTDVGADTVIARLAKENHLGFSDEYGIKHYIWPQMAQTDESDWEFATSLCTRIGGVLLCTNGVLRIVDPANILRRTAPLVYTTRDQSDGNTDTYDFMPAHLTDRLPSQFSPTVGYLSGQQSVVLSQTTRVTLPLSYSGVRPLRNIEEAKMAQVRLPVDWEEQATARLKGDDRIEPGSVIYFKTGQKISFNAPYDGLWYVWRVQHTMTGHVYQSKVDVARVTNSAVMPSVPGKFWYTGPRGRPQIVRSQDGQWASTWR